MSAKDKFHERVRNALIKEGWNITHDPYYLKVGRRKTFIDLAAETPIAAEKDGRKIAVEIKSILGQSSLNDIENALGQFGLYRAVLYLRDPERTLYLAVPYAVREMLLEEKDFRYILQEFQARLIFYDPDERKPLEWIEQPSSVGL